jgi:hypothetical protein
VHAGLDVLSSSVNPVTGKILIQTGNAIKSSTDADAVELWQQAGICSVPSKPIAGTSAAQATVLKTSDRDICVATQDVRALSLYGNISYGEVCIYAAGAECLSQGRILLKDDGSVTAYTTATNRAGGASVYARVAKGTDDATGAPDGHSWVGPWGTVKFNDTGYHTVHISGAELHMGGIYGMPAPLDAIASWIKLSAGTIHLECSALSVGIGATFPLANATAVMAAIAGLQAQVTALQAALAIFANPTLNPLIAAASVDSGAVILAASTTGAVAGIAAITAANLVMPTTASATL